MKLIKKTLLFIFIFFAIAALTLWGLTLTLNPDRVKGMFDKKLTTITGQQSHINGDIHWQLFPRPGLKVTDIQVGEEKGDEDYSLVINNLLFNLRIRPLLKGQLVFSDIKIDGFKLKIKSNTNHSKVKLRKKTADTPSNPALNTTNNTPVQFAIDSFLLTNGELHLNTQQAKFSFSDLKIGASDLNLKNDSFPIQLKGNLNALLGQDKLKASFNFQGTTKLSELLNYSRSHTLSSVAFEGKIAISDLIFNQLKLDKIDANASFKKEVLKLNPLNIKLYKGSSIGDLTYPLDSRLLSMNQTATNLDASSLFKSLIDKDILQGNLDFSIHANADLTKKDWLEKIQANGRLTIKDGIFRSFNIPKLLKDLTHQVQALRHQQKINAQNIKSLLETEPDVYQDGTSFQLLSIQYRLTEKKLITDSLLLQTKQLNLKGKGRINLNDFTMNNQLEAKLITSDNKLNEVQDILGGSFPLILSGTLTQPLILPDLKEMSPALMHYFLKQQLNKPINKLKQQLKSEMKHLTRF